MDLSKWAKWLSEPSQKFLASKIMSPAKFDKHHLLEVHGATEATLRKILLIGLRKQKVTYENAWSFLHEYDKTPGRGNNKGDFQNIVEILYGTPWTTVLTNNNDLNLCWELWLDFAKKIRNDLSHGIRQHSPDTIEIALMINASILIELDKEFNPRIGGSLFQDLTDLSPRLPRGSQSNDPKSLLGIKPKKQVQTKLSATQAKIKADIVDRFI